MRMQVERIVTAAALVVLAAPQVAAAQARVEERLVVGDQITYEPGYAIGDITVTDVRIADFKVLPGREKLLLLGRTAGQTLLNLTDQRRALRTVVTLIVESREVADLREMLSAYDAVEVRQLGDNAIVTGTVDTREDVEAVTKLAKAAGAQSLVTLAPGAAGTADSSASGTPKRALPTEIEFEVDILEASVAFESGSYATGVEPSGRRLHQQIVRVPVGSEGDIFVPVSALGRRMVEEVRDQTRKKDNPNVGIHMRLEPSAPTENNLFSTFVLIATNVPVEEAKDTRVMRRARWELESAPGEPFALAGAQLLAVPAAVKSSGSKFGRVMRAIGSFARLPGVRRTPAREYTTGIPYYDREKKTQLLALFKPRMIGNQETGIRKQESGIR